LARGIFAGGVSTNARSGALVGDLAAIAIALVAFALLAASIWLIGRVD